MDWDLYLLAIVVFAALVQSGFSLGTGLMALLSGHSLSRRRSHARLLGLTAGFVIGAFAMTVLLVLAATYALVLLNAIWSPLLTLILGTLTALAGTWVIFFYYRRGRDGSALWLPRSFARYLSERAAHTKSPVEGFVLGGASVVYELPATTWLILVASLSIGSLGTGLQIPVALGYGVLAVITLLATFILIGGGHTHAALMRFRTDNKRFLQVLTGGSMVIIGAAVFWNAYYQVVSNGGTPW